MKLTPTQIEILSPIIEAKNTADANLLGAVTLIVGRKVAGYSFKDGELTITEIEEKKGGKRD